MRRDVDKLYRFALYGRSDSGKTCFLATMAMGSVGHPRGLTCERLPVKVPKPQDGDTNNSVADNEARALHFGKEWIDNAVRALDSGDRPDFNPAIFDGNPATVDFQIGTPSRGDFMVRTVDYSGELIHPGEEHQLDSHVNALRDCLADCDGFLILADTPRPDDDQKMLSEEIRLLRESFASLRESSDNALQTPVAVVITKWDRSSEVDFSQPEEELEKLRNYLTKSPIHNSLVETVRNAQVEQEDDCDTFATGLFFGNCGVFPTTAFGRATEKEGFDAPIVGEQHPFGLLEPFLWLATRRDYLDANQLQQEWSGHRQSSWVPWRLAKTRRFSTRATRQLKKLPRKSPSTAIVRSIRRAASWSFRLAVIGWLAVLAFVLEMGYEKFRTYQFQQAVAERVNPTTKEIQLRELRGWFDRYSRVWNGFLFSPSSDDAIEQAHQIDNAIDDRYWSKVADANDPAAKVKAAREYLVPCKNGRHAAECGWIVNEYDAHLAKEENTDWLSARKKEYGNSAGNLERSLQLQSTLRQHLPKPRFATDEQRKQLRDLKTDTSNDIAVIIDQIDWEKFQVALREAMKAGDVIAASQLLASRTKRDERWTKVVQEFPKEVHDTANKVADNHRQSHRYVDAKNVADDGKHALKDLETTIRPDNPSLAKLLEQGQRDLSSLAQTIESQHDEYLYQMVRNHSGDKNVCRVYINNAPLGTMARVVAAHRKILETRTQRMTVSVEVKIMWDKDYSDGEHNVVRVFLDDVQVLKTEYVAVTPGKLTGVVGSFRIKNKRLNESVQIKITITEEDRGFIPFDEDDDAGQGSTTVKLHELIERKSIALPPKNGASFKNEARLQIAAKDRPPEPELPQWKAP